MLDALGIERDSPNEEAIPLQNNEITGKAFKKAVEWCEKNRADPKSAPDAPEDDEDVSIFGDFAPK